MNKKAIVFTFITVIFVVLLVASFLLAISNRAQRDIQKTNIKVETLSSFVNTLNNELLEETLRASSNQLFLAFLDELENPNSGVGKGSYIQGGVNTVFAEALMTGHYKDQKLRIMIQDNLNYTLMKALEELSIFAQDNGAILSILPIPRNNINVYHQDPWHLNVSFVVTYSLNDSRNEVSWGIKNKQISILLDLQNYRDPFYLVADNLNVTINKTDVTTWTFDEFRRHITNSLFRAHSDAPSFLKRLQGDKTADTNGIEAILDPNFYPNSGQFSNVDFEYRSNIHGDCTVNGMPNEFRLTSIHLTYYQQTGTCGL